MSNESLGAVILGAGASSRMGRPKLLLPWHERTVIAQIIGQWRQLGAKQITVVHRPGDKVLLRELDLLNVASEDRIVNPEPARGMFSSIQCAANWNGWRPDIAVWSIILGDQPQLCLKTLHAILVFSRRHPDAICQPEYDGHGRHPVLLPRSAFEDLKSSPAKNLKEFLKCNSRQLVKCPMDDPTLPLDMDTPEDYIRLHNFLNP